MAEAPHLFPKLWGEDYYSGAIMTCGVRAITRKIVDQKSIIIHRGTAEINVTIKDLKDVRVVIPTTFPLKSPIWPVKKTEGS